MKRLVGIAAALACGLSVSACDGLSGTQAPAPDQPVETGGAPDTSAERPAAEPEIVRPAAAERTGEIDWASARDDLASIPSEERDGSFQIAAGDDAPPVPVLLPTGIVMPAGAEDQVKFQPLKDGYFAAYPGVTYDIIVNGTNEVIGSGARGDVSDASFLATASGAQVSFSRYGADYLVEFECNEIDGATGTCLTEDEALDMAKKLVIAGTR